jgi:hypothetical protein
MTQAAQLAQYGANNVGLSFKNRIINGDMAIAQRGTGVFTNNVSSGDLFAVDRFNSFVSGSSGVFTAQQTNDVPTGSGFSRSVILTVTTADASLATGDLCAFRQIIEGFNAADLMWGTANAQPVTLSFWAKSSVTGTHSGTLTNGDWTRAYAFSYTITAANTWQFVTITAPGAPSGSWGNTNDRGIQVVFNMGAASANLSAANTWTTTSAVTVGATGSVQLISTNGATFYITGVQLEKGTVATSFDYLPYGTELVLCQRYYQAWFPAEQELIYNESGSADGKFWQLYMPVQMRTAPTSTYSSGMLGGNVIGLPGTISSLSLSSASRNRISTRVTMTAGGGSANLIYHCDSIGSGDFVGLNSEL